MNSKTKWLLMGPVCVTLGLLFFWLFMNVNGILAFATFVIADILFAGGIGFWGYGWTEKVKVFSGPSSWMNKDGWK